MNIGRKWAGIITAAVLTGIVTFSFGMSDGTSADAAAGRITSATAGEHQTELVTNEIPPKSRILFDIPESALPGTVYVLENGRIVTESPATQEEITAVEEPTNTTGSGIVSASFTVIPSRIIVVNDNDEIIKIWNNTLPDDSFYSLKVKLNDAFGPEQALTPEIAKSYNTLLGQANLSVQGQIYPKLTR